MQKTTLIIDKRLELSTKYKKLIEGTENFVEISHDLTFAIKFIQENEPDLIIISDSIDESLADFCKKIRVLTFNSRPIIIALSKSAEVEDKLQVLENGADDFLSEPINSDEFKVRIKAHLRREDEVNISTKTMLPNKAYSIKTLKRNLSKDSTWACLCIKVENFENYKEIYTELASDKLIQTFCAIIASALDDSDYLGHLAESEFLIITNTLKAEKIASFLSFAFDSVASKFYSDEDAKRGYTILQGDERAGRRSEFVFITVGVVSNEFKKYKSTEQILHSLRQMRHLAKKPSGSSFAIERPKLSTSEAAFEKEFNNKVLVLEEDEALSYLLSTALELQGYDVEVFENAQALSTLLSTKLPFNDIDPPGVIILDAGNIETMSGLDLCTSLKSKEEFKNTRFIMTSILHDKEKILNAGADLYLPKPYELATLTNWVKIFLREIN